MTTRRWRKRKISFIVELQQRQWHFESDLSIHPPLTTQVPNLFVQVCCCCCKIPWCVPWPSSHGVLLDSYSYKMARTCTHCCTYGYSVLWCNRPVLRGSAFRCATAFEFFNWMGQALIRWLIGGSLCTPSSPELNDSLSELSSLSILISSSDESRCPLLRVRPSTIHELR